MPATVISSGFENPKYTRLDTSLELQKDLDVLRRQMATMEKDATFPDTRLADDSMKFNPARVGTLIHLMLGALHHIAHETQFIGTPTQDMQDHIRHGKIHAKRTGHRGSLLHSRLRYFDPQKRRSGIPEDVAALVTKLSATETVVTLVNIDQVNAKSSCKVGPTGNTNVWRST